MPERVDVTESQRLSFVFFSPAVHDICNGIVPKVHSRSDYVSAFGPISTAAFNDSDQVPGKMPTGSGERADKLSARLLFAPEPGKAAMGLMRVFVLMSLSDKRKIAMLDCVHKTR